MPLTFEEVRNNIHKGNVKHFNECRSNFMKDNKEDLDVMLTNILCGLPIEILSGPCRGMTLKTKYDLHLYIDKHAADMAGEDIAWRR